MTVPALDTSNIGLFAYLQPATEVQIADVLPYLYSFEQFPEYVDGTMKIWDSGSESAFPNNFRLVNVRVRTDGYLMAWFPRKLVESGGGNTFTADASGHSGQTIKDSDMAWRYWWRPDGHSLLQNELAGFTLKFTSGNLSGNEYTIESNSTDSITLHPRYGDNLSTDVSGIGADNYEILGNLGNSIWWSGASDSGSNPPQYSTTLGRAIYEMWIRLKNNSDNPTYTFNYADVNHYNYEYPTATKLLIVGYQRGTGNNVFDTRYWYITIPFGVDLLKVVCNYTVTTGIGWNDYVIKLDDISILEENLGWYYKINGYINLEKTSAFLVNQGVQHVIYQRTPEESTLKCGFVFLF